jgi:WD40 repeat protein
LSVTCLVLSKSVHNTILLWKPDFSWPILWRVRPTDWSPPSGATVLCESTTRVCDLWFVRFSTTAKCKHLAIGNSKGEIKLWDIDNGNSNKKSLCVLTHAQCTSMIRMISFCPDSTCFVAVYVT